MVEGYAGGVRAIILAAGRSRRFRRKHSKLVAPICGRPMILFPLHVLEKFAIPTTLVLGHQADEIRECVTSFNMQNVDYVFQGEPLGTGDAVFCSQKNWDREHILILNGDAPLLTPDLVKRLLAQHLESDATVSFVTTHMINPKGYGRVVEVDGKLSIYEEKDCPSEHKDINRVNAGIYVVKRSFLQEQIQKLKRSEVSGEFYITDLIAAASNAGETVQAVPGSFDVVRGVNTMQELWAVEQIMRSNLIKHWMKQGVRFELAQSNHIDIDVEIGADSFIGTGVHLLGNTKIGEECFIAAFTILENATIGDRNNIHSHSVIQDSTTGKEVHVGPFARLRSNVVIVDNGCVGNFVEVKKSTIGKNAKVKHLSYVGDATLGSNVNIGAGTIFCNYDGAKKHKTVVEDDAFVGSNNTLVAPVKIGQGAYAAAGSTITNDVPSEDLAIARARQENKKGYAKKLKRKKGAGQDDCPKKCCEVRKKEELKFHFLGAVKSREGSEDCL